MVQNSAENSMDRCLEIMGCDLHGQVVEGGGVRIR